MATPPTSKAIAEWIASCPKIPAGDYVRACMGGKGWEALVAPWAFTDRPLSTQDLVSILCAIGWFEPRGLTEPRACDIVTSFDDMVELPPATTVDGEVVPSTGVLIKICAPNHRTLVVDFLEGIAANLTAWESGELFSKAMSVPGFSEMFCPPGEPGPGSPTDEGVFSNIRRVVLCPKAGFDLSARNHSTTSSALFHVKATMWATC